MKYIGAKNGKVLLLEKDCPKIKENYVLIKTKYSAISPGTEIGMSKNTKDISITLGYSAAGEIVEVGAGAEEFVVGERVACYGAPYVYHSEYLLVPKTLCVKVPDSVSLKDAAMGGIGAIAIHGLRQANLQFGEIIVVVGLGIYGQLIGQIGVNAGYQVVALNRSSPRADLFTQITGQKSFIDEKEMEQYLHTISSGKGADATFLCAGGEAGYLTNKSLEWLRDRGTSVIVGDIQPVYERSKMFSKEIQIKISRAGGPGRYDPSYEKEAVDYPYGQVRWTEGRNVGEFIRLLSEKRIITKDFYSGTVPFNEVQPAYEQLSQKGSSVLTQIIEYP